MIDTAGWRLAVVYVALDLVNHTQDTGGHDSQRELDGAAQPHGAGAHHHAREAAQAAVAPLLALGHPIAQQVQHMLGTYWRAVHAMPEARRHNSREESTHRRRRRRQP
eukprot:COSAG01_NODE_1050_length_11922_cov_8.014632_3_plen_108_part_00